MDSLSALSSSRDSCSEGNNRPSSIEARKLLEEGRAVVVVAPDEEPSPVYSPAAASAP